MLCSSCGANHDSQVLRKRLSRVLFFSGYQTSSVHIRGDGFLYSGIFVFLRGAVIKISRKSVASLSFHRYSYTLEICSNGCRDNNADNNDIRDALYLYARNDAIDNRMQLSANF